MKVALVFAFLVSAALGFEAWTTLRRAEELCHVGRALARGTPVLESWLREARAEPFLGASALRGPPFAVIAFYRGHARQLSGELAARLLPKETRYAFRAVADTPMGDPDMEKRLAGLRPATRSLVCRSVRAPSAEEEKLARLLAEAGHFWADRHALVAQDKKEFARDQEIFCRADGLLRRLHEVVSAATLACREAKPGSKLALGCGADAKQAPGTASVEAEIEELEKEKEINARKLRQKWPDAVVAGLRC